MKVVFLKGGEEGKRGNSKFDLRRPARGPQLAKSMVRSRCGTKPLGLVGPVRAAPTFLILPDPERKAGYSTCGLVLVGKRGETTILPYFSISYVVLDVVKNNDCAFWVLMVPLILILHQICSINLCSSHFQHSYCCVSISKSQVPLQLTILCCILLPSIVKSPSCVVVYSLLLLLLFRSPSSDLSIVHPNAVGTQL